ncbi:hypothetical protein LX81_02709 [Palleronia aestuarii]|uniref:Uncharacterized protein n=1 Tax=Palleronia aestuarii TaxID=568105 RepID=A0A2W7N4X2_9RHOB|nr:hypothetical protein [Palleronia aestuarii]PZX15120.1 hypothetical protein LX81_02709 [Palleronia aestuarii]
MAKTAAVRAPELIPMIPGLAKGVAQHELESRAAETETAARHQRQKRPWQSQIADQ